MAQRAQTLVDQLAERPDGIPTSSPSQITWTSAAPPNPHLGFGAGIHVIRGLNHLPITAQLR